MIAAGCSSSGLHSLWVPTRQSRVSAFLLKKDSYCLRDSFGIGHTQMTRANGTEGLAKDGITQITCLHISGPDGTQSMRATQTEILKGEIPKQNLKSITDSKEFRCQATMPLSTLQPHFHSNLILHLGITFDFSSCLVPILIHSEWRRSGLKSYFYSFLAP